MYKTRDISRWKDAETISKEVRECSIHTHTRRSSEHNGRDYARSAVESCLFFELALFVRHACHRVDQLRDATRFVFPAIRRLFEFFNSLTMMISTGDMLSKHCVSAK